MNIKMFGVATQRGAVSHNFVKPPQPHVALLLTQKSQKLALWYLDTKMAWHRGDTSKLSTRISHSEWTRQGPLWDLTLLVTLGAPPPPTQPRFVPRRRPSSDTTVVSTPEPAYFATRVRKTGKIWGFVWKSRSWTDAPAINLNAMSKWHMHFLTLLTSQIYDKGFSVFCNVVLRIL